MSHYLNLVLKLYAFSIILYYYRHNSRNFCKKLGAGVEVATDSMQLFDSRVHYSLVVAYSRLRHTRVGRTLEYATTG